MAGHATPENLCRAEDAGADAVLTKPCDPRKLIAIIQAILSR
jgi:DNA-binding response OmpR family regulator